MINRYGPWMDTNVVTPTGPNTCVVHFDYFLEAGEFLFISVWAISMTSCFVYRTAFQRSDSNDVRVSLFYFNSRMGN